MGLFPSFRFVSVKLKLVKSKMESPHLKKNGQELYPVPTRFSFLDDQIDQLYRSEYELTQAYFSFCAL